jgi:hypothetical protein
MSAVFTRPAPAASSCTGSSIPGGFPAMSSHHPSSRKKPGTALKPTAGTPKNCQTSPRRHRHLKFLLRQGIRHEGKSWTQVHWNWIRSWKFDDTNMQTVLAESILALEQELERVHRRGKVL